MPDERTGKPSGPRHVKYEHLVETARKLPPTKTAIAHPCDQSLPGKRCRGRQARPDCADPGWPAGAHPRGRGTLEPRHQRHADRRAEHSHDSAVKAVEQVRCGAAEALMKGSLHTDELMGAVVSKTDGIRTARRISHCFIMDVPNHPDPLIITDAAMNIAPTLDDKVDIIQNAIDLAHAMRFPEVRVAILSAMETVTSKVPSTVEAAALCKMAERGQITGALLDGPLALDNAISLEAAAIKRHRLEGRRPRQRAGRAGPGGGQHAGQKPDIPGRRRRRRHRPRRARADHADQPGGYVADAACVVRGGGPGGGCAAQGDGGSGRLR